ncbi:hypothetical protein, partial [Schlesneria sp.]|uniref:hypothetical protein n=1 Tax=Schlesneria sp. TaxID=2762018 RepID=UPI002F1BC249
MMQDNIEPIREMAGVQSTTSNLWNEYYRLSGLAINGGRSVVEAELVSLLLKVTEPALQARIYNDLGVLESLDYRQSAAIRSFRLAIELQPEWPLPQENLSHLQRQRNSFGSRNGTPRTRV